MLPTWQRSLLLASTLLTAIAAVPACVTDDRACNAAYYYSGLYVETIGTLPNDTYAVKVTADGAVVTIGVEISDAATRCIAECIAEVVVGGERLIVNAELYAGGGFVNIHYGDGGGPAQVDVEILRGADSIAHELFTPTYSTSEPNGLGCGEVTAAQGELMIVAQ